MVKQIPREPAVASNAEPVARVHDQRSWTELVEAWVFPALTIGLAVLFSLLPATAGVFNSSSNFKIILASQAAVVLVTLAVLVPIVVNVWDFTPGANAGLSCIVAAYTVSTSGSFPLAIVACLAMSLLVALFNAALVVGLRVHSVIATLGMTILIAGTIQAITNGESIVNGAPLGLTSWASDTTLGIPNIAYIGIVALIGTDLLLRKTPFGRYLFATGSNRRAARLLGLKTNLVTTVAFLISGALAGIGGVLLLAQTGSGNPTLGPDLTLPAYAAVFLGTVAISPGRWNVWGTAWAILFLAIISSGLVLAGANNAMTQFANGAALLVGVGLSNLVARQRGRTIEVA